MTDVSIETQDAKKFNAEAFAMNIARAMESSGQALAAYLTPRATGECGWTELFTRWTSTSISITL